MKTKKEILEETANFYHSLNRGYEIGGCVYLTDDGKMCAVGRCLINPKEFVIDGVGLVNEIGKEYFDKNLKEDYIGHSLSFWRDLQIFHDMDKFWNISGMTQEGHSQYNMLLNRWS